MHACDGGPCCQKKHAWHTGSGLAAPAPAAGKVACICTVTLTWLQPRDMLEDLPVHKSSSF